MDKQTDGTKFTLNIMHKLRCTEPCTAADIRDTHSTCSHHKNTNRTQEISAEKLDNIFMFSTLLIINATMTF